MENLMNTIEQAVEAWKKEDSENRAIIVIATQRIEKEDGKNDMSSCDLVIGEKGLLVDLLYHRMSDRNEDKNEHNVLPALLRRAMSRFDLDVMFSHLSKQASKIEKMAKKLGLWDDDKE
jgi:hypothetical protein